MSGSHRTRYSLMHLGTVCPNCGRFLGPSSEMLLVPAPDPAVDPCPFPSEEPST